MDRGAWRATVHGVARVRHDLVTKPHHHQTVKPSDPQHLHLLPPSACHVSDMILLTFLCII